MALCGAVGRGGGGRRRSRADAAAAARGGTGGGGARGLRAEAAAAAATRHGHRRLPGPHALAGVCTRYASRRYSCPQDNPSAFGVWVRSAVPLVLTVSVFCQYVCVCAGLMRRSQRREVNSRPRCVKSVGGADAVRTAARRRWPTYSARCTTSTWRTAEATAEAAVVGWAPKREPSHDEARLLCARRTATRRTRQHAPVSTLSMLRHHPWRRREAPRQRRLGRRATRWQPCGGRTLRRRRAARGS